MLKECRIQGMVRGLLCAAAFVSVAGGAAAQDVEWQFASAYGDNTVVTKNIRMFIDEVEKQSEGRFEIVLQNNAKLFKMPEIKRAVQTQQVQIGEILLSAYGNEDPLLEADVLPTMAQTPEESAMLWGLTEPEISALFMRTGVRPIFAHYWTGQGYFSKQPISSPTDFAGQKQRVMNPSGAKWAEMMGATGVLVQYAELGQALALGTVDSFFAAPAAVINSKGWGVARLFLSGRTDAREGARSGERSCVSGAAGGLARHPRYGSAACIRTGARYGAGRGRRSLCDHRGQWDDARRGNA